jgi:hypothetical protein
MRKYFISYYWQNAYDPTRLGYGYVVVEREKGICDFEDVEEIVQGIRTEHCKKVIPLYWREMDAD